MRRGVDWRGVAAAVLALGVVAAVIIGEVFAFLNKDRTVTTEEVATLSTVLGAAVGAVGGYIGGYIAARRPPPNGPPALPRSTDGGAGEPPAMNGPGGEDGA
jgi:hypothetical protein